MSLDDEGEGNGGENDEMNKHILLTTRSEEIDNKYRQIYIDELNNIVIQDVCGSERGEAIIQHNCTLWTTLYIEFYFDIDNASQRVGRARVFNASHGDKKHFGPYYEFKTVNPPTRGRSSVCIGASKCKNENTFVDYFFGEITAVESTSHAIISTDNIINSEQNPPTNENSVKNIQRVPLPLQNTIVMNHTVY